MASLTDLVPVSRSEFAAEIAPCLALASGVGMSEADQRIWMNAAFKALSGIPITLLKRGAAHAMGVADHPSKIVPAIRSEIGDSWEWRKRHAAAPRYRPALPAPIETEEEKIERLEVAKLMDNLARKLSAKTESEAA